MSDPLNDEIKATSAVHIENLTHVPHLDASTQIPVTKHEEGLLTVLGTSGQDPNKKKNVGFTEYVILVLSALAQFQNVVGVSRLSLFWTIILVLTPLLLTS